MENEPVDKNDPIMLICPNGHRFIITYLEWDMGYGCPGCALNRAAKKDEVWAWQYCNQCKKVEPCTMNEVPDELLKAFDKADKEE